MKEKKLKGSWDDDIFHLVSGFADVTLFLLFFRPIHEKTSMKLMNILVFLVFLQTHEQFLGAIAEVIWGEGLEKKETNDAMYWN